MGCRHPRRRRPRRRCPPVAGATATGATVPRTVVQQEPVAFVVDHIERDDARLGLRLGDVEVDDRPAVNVQRVKAWRAAGRKVG